MFAVAIIWSEPDRFKLAALFQIFNTNDKKVFTLRLLDRRPWICGKWRL